MAVLFTAGWLICGHLTHNVPAASSIVTLLCSYTAGCSSPYSNLCRYCLLWLRYRVAWGKSQAWLLTVVLHLQKRSLVGEACHVISDMAYVIPDAVLPLAYERFQVSIPLHI